MFIVQIYLHLKPECVEEFKKAIIENATSSLKEPGVVRFDILQEQDNSDKFTLLEVYKEKEDFLKHKETAHYHKCKAIISEMMAQPTTGQSYINVFPADGQWNIINKK